MRRRRRHVHRLRVLQLEALRAGVALGLFLFEEAVTRLGDLAGHYVLQVKQRCQEAATSSNLKQTSKRRIILEYQASKSLQPKPHDITEYRPWSLRDEKLVHSLLVLVLGVADAGAAAEEVPPTRLRQLIKRHSLATELGPVPYPRQVPPRSDVQLLRDQ